MPFESLPKLGPIFASICYLIRGPEIPGRFYPDKAKALGVPIGPLCGVLKNGAQITLPNGTVVRPEQVTDPSQPGSVSFYLDIPSRDYFESLFVDQEAAFQPFRNNASAKVDCIVHQLGPGVLTEPKYQQWLLSFGMQTQHIVFAPSLSDQRLVFTSSALFQSYLHDLSPGLFPCHRHFTTSLLREQLVELSKQGCAAASAEPLLLFHLTPGPHLDASQAMNGHLPPKQPFKYQTPKPKPPALTAKPHRLPGTQTDNLEVTFLGTGSALPSKYRNGKSALVSSSAHPHVPCFLLSLFTHIHTHACMHSIRDLLVHRRIWQHAA